MWPRLRFNLLTSTWNYLKLLWEETPTEPHQHTNINKRLSLIFSRPGHRWLRRVLVVTGMRPTSCEVRLTADLRVGDGAPGFSPRSSPSSPCSPEMKLTRRPAEIDGSPQHLLCGDRRRLDLHVCTVICSSANFLGVFPVNSDRRSRNIGNINQFRCILGIKGSDCSL